MRCHHKHNRLLSFSSLRDSIPPPVLSKPTPSPVSASPSSKPRRRNTLFLAFRIGCLLILLALCSLSEPTIFKFALRQLLGFEAWRADTKLSIERIDGSIFSPATVYGTRCDFVSRTGAVVHLEIARADVEVDWSQLIQGAFDRWFKRLSLEGVTARVDSSEPNGVPRMESPQPWYRRLKPTSRWFPCPETLSIDDLNIALESGKNSVRIEKSRIFASKLQKGTVFLGHLAVQEPWLERSFRNVTGKTALQDSKFVLADLQLEPGLVIHSLSTQPLELARGRMNVELQATAFDGKLRVEAQTQASQTPRPLEASAQFENISIAKLSHFLRLSDATGGTIKVGNFTFHGSPRRLQKSTAALRLEATNFQWETRQWDSLTLIGSLVDRRLQIAKADLHQGHNRLNLSGELAIPKPGEKWWQNEFTCNIAAKIADLTELSALLLPEFKYTAGKAAIDGSIRGRNKEFAGQLIISGSQLKWRNAPIENLHAALKLDGNECQFTNLEVFNNGDYVRAWGSVNILGERQYRGRLRASIEDLAIYAAILQKPVVPEPLAGKAIVEWSGEGSVKGQNGEFFARLNKVRTLGALASQLHPINVDLQGSYTRAGMQFSHFALSDDESALTANVGVGNSALSLKGIRLTHGDHLALEGDALLPLDVWKAWPNTSLAQLLNTDTVSAVSLKATRLDLKAASQLTGWNFPVAGVLDGSLSVSGPVAALNSAGTLRLAKGRIPLGWSGESLTSVDCTAALKAADLHIESAHAEHRFANLQIDGVVSLKKIQDPHFALHLKSAKAHLPLFGNQTARRGLEEAQIPSIHAAASLISGLDLNLEGSMSAPQLRGAGQLQELDLGPAPNIAALWQPSGSAQLSPPFQPVRAPWNTWTLDIGFKTGSAMPLKSNPGTVLTDVRLKGNGSAPFLVGTVQFRGVNATTAHAPLRIETATLVFPQDTPGNPTLDLVAESQLLTSNFSAYCTGPLSHLIRWFVLPPPLNETLVWQALSGQATGPSAPITAPLASERLELHIPAVHSQDADSSAALDLALPANAQAISVLSWPPIPTPIEPAPLGNSLRNLPPESQPVP
jgi:hypothetical protein